MNVRIRQEFSDEELAARGRVAQRMLDEGEELEVFDEVKRRVYAGWLSADSVEDRETAWAMTHAVEEVQRVLRSIAADGVVAEDMIDKREKA